jgi:hypothetical protein
VAVAVDAQRFEHRRLWNDRSVLWPAHQQLVVAKRECERPSGNVAGGE